MQFATEKVSTTMALRDTSGEQQAETSKQLCWLELYAGIGGMRAAASGR